MRGASGGEAGGLSGRAGTGRAVAGHQRRVRPRAGPAASVSGLCSRRAVPLSRGRHRRLPGARHRVQDLAPPRLLSTPGVRARPRAASALPRTWRAAGDGAVGAARVRLHAAVRGAASGVFGLHAGQGDRASGRRARHAHLAGAGGLRRARPRRPALLAGHPPGGGRGLGASAGRTT
jgi:hypothetical protein